MERKKRVAQTDKHTQAETTGEDGDRERQKRGTDR